MNWYKKNITEISSDLDVNLNTGLNEEDVNLKREQYGWNSLREERKLSLATMFLSQFKNFMVIVLLIASAVSAFLGELSDTLTILLVVISNAALGVAQEYRAEKSLEALKKLSSPMAKVIRSGRRAEIPSKELVPGDIIILEAGDFVPADGILFECANLRVEESSLTGESVPVDKFMSIPEGDDIPLGDRKNSVFASGLITNGRAMAIVTDTGMNTEIGQIAKLLENQTEDKTPLQKKLDQLGKTLGILAIAICGAIFIIGYLQGIPAVDMFMISVSLAVAAIPEGLPAIVTIVLSIGVQRMISKNAIVRNLPAVETLGTASVICSDKTGTLTQNKMTVTKLYTYGEFQNIEDVNLSRKDVNLAFKIGLLCNDSTVEMLDGKENALGDPTELALVFSAKLLGLSKAEVARTYKRVAEIPFDSNRKLMTTVHEKDGNYYIFTKGAVDSLLERCSSVQIGDNILEFTDEMKTTVLKANETMSSDALRVLALAYKLKTELPAKLISEEVEKGLVFVGLKGMIDPPREEVREAVAKCRMAGIKPVMITGDHKVTAMAIAKTLGIMDVGDEATEGKEIEQMSESDLIERVEKYSVYARVSPEHKVRIVDAWQSRNKVVAMTGDGVNDAPALKSADIGCAMGITGTDVSKQASDIILTDDNFATIVSAVEEGRHIFDNIKKSVHFLLSCNIGELFVLFVAVVLGMPIPLLPIHILWINLVTDSLPALALGVDPPEPDIMKKLPRDPSQSIFGDGMGISIVLQGAVIGFLALSAFKIGQLTSLELGRTMTFATLALSQIVHAFNVRSRDKSIFQLGMFSNIYLIGASALSVFVIGIILVIPQFREIFKLTSLNTIDFLYIAGLSLLPLVISEAFKLLKRVFKNEF